MSICESRILAEMPDERYIWYPDIHSQEEMLKEKQILEETSSDIQVTIYSLEGTRHLEDFNRWKDSLVSRSMTFKKEGFVFNDEKIKSLSPTGYIVLIRS